MSIDFSGVWSLALTLSALVVLALMIEWRRKPKPIKPEPKPIKPEPEQGLDDILER